MLSLSRSIIANYQQQEANLKQQIHHKQLLIRYLTFGGWGIPAVEKAELELKELQKDLEEIQKILQEKH